MKFSTHYSTLLLLLIIFFMPSCRTPKDLVYKDFQNLRMEKMGFSSSIIKLDLLFYNPNKFGLKLKSTDLDIFIDNNFIGHTAQEYEINIPKRGDFSLPIQLDVDMKNVLLNALTGLLNKEVTVKLMGTIILGKLNVYKSFPVNYESIQKIAVF